MAVFHRPSKNTWLVLLVWWLRARNVKVLAEFDDLIFDTTYCEFSPGVLNNVLSLQKTKKKYLAHQRALKLFDSFTVSTEPLRNKLSAMTFQGEIIVSPNTPHHFWRKKLDHLPISVIDWNKPVITYLPGTRSHDRDFQVFAKGITRFLNDNPQVSLQVTGLLQFELAVNPAQIIRRDKVDFAEYHQQIAHGWVNLAPLEDTPFTRCKSALKIIEAGYWGRPTLCSPIPDAERFIGHGAIIVKSTDDLYGELTKLLNPEYYYAYVKDLRQRILKLSHIDTDQFKNQ